jgi:hypothetical protein
VIRKGMTPLTVVESQTHFALWCVTSSPLLLSMELTGANSGTPTWHKMMEIVQNKNAIWVNRERTPQFRNRCSALILWRGSVLIAAAVLLPLLPLLLLLPPPPPPLLLLLLILLLHDGVTENFVDAPLGSLPIAGDLVRQNSTRETGGNEAVWAKPVPIPSGHKGKSAVAVVLFNSGDAGKVITLDFALFGAAFKGAQAVVFDVHAGKDLAGTQSGHYTSGSIVRHGCEFVVVVFQ